MPTCPAYPDGIPDDIRKHGADHRQQRGDETSIVVFDLSESADEADVEAWDRWKTAMMITEMELQLGYELPLE